MIGAFTVDDFNNILIGIAIVFTWGFVVGFSLNNMMADRKGK